MATQELGRIRQLDARKMWPNEAHDFTPWLSRPENLQLLGDTLGIELEFVKREASVGPYSLDILARERGSRGRYVAIENQLEFTDHTHLGQLITYAAGYQAEVLVWVAPEFSNQHRDAISWLNQWTHREVECFGVEVRVLSIDDSIPAPEFLPVAVPRNWAAGNPRLRFPSRPTLLDAERYREFFQQLLDDLRGVGFTDETEAVPDADQRFPSGLRDYISYYAGFDKDGAWVYLWFVGGRGKRDFANKVYDSLASAEDWESIEGSFTGEWLWDRQSVWWYFSISLRKDASINDPPQKLDQIRAWMLEALPKFREVFNPRLEKILSELEEA